MPLYAGPKSDDRGWQLAVTVRIAIRSIARQGNSGCKGLQVSGGDLGRALRSEGYGAQRKWDENGENNLGMQWPGGDRGCKILRKPHVMVEPGEV